MSIRTPWGLLYGIAAHGRGSNGARWRTSRRSARKEERLLRISPARRAAPATRAYRMPVRLGCCAYHACRDLMKACAIISCTSLRRIVMFDAWKAALPRSGAARFAALHFISQAHCGYCTRTVHRLTASSSFARALASTHGPASRYILPYCAVRGCGTAVPSPDNLPRCDVMPRRASLRICALAHITRLHAAFRSRCRSQIEKCRHAMYRHTVSLCTHASFHGYLSWPVSINLAERLYRNWKVRSPSSRYIFCADISTRMR